MSSRISVKEFQTRLKNIIPFMSEQDAHYYYLCGVLIKKQADKLILVATDGHILQESVMTIDNVVEDFQGILPDYAVKNLVNNLENYRFEYLVLSFDGIKFTFDCGDFNYSVKAVDGTYPDYKRTFPPEKERQTNGLNAKYLKTILPIFGNTPITISCEMDSAPQVFRNDNGITALIMPARI